MNRIEKLSVIMLCILCFTLGMLLEYQYRWEEINAPKVELPEEYKCITRNDTLVGHFDSDGVLHIEFNNHKNK